MFLTIGIEEVEETDKALCLDTELVLLAAGLEETVCEEAFCEVTVEEAVLETFDTAEEAFEDTMLAVLDDGIEETVVSEAAEEAMLETKETEEDSTELNPESKEVSLVSLTTEL